jgi:hypothetical protein
MLGVAEKCPNVCQLGAPDNCVASLLRASHVWCGEPEAASLLRAAAALVARFANVFSKELQMTDSGRSNWRIICDLCRGVSGTDTSVICFVCPEVVRGAWGIAEKFLRNSDSVILLIGSRVLPTLLSAVAPHSPPGIIIFFSCLFVLISFLLGVAAAALVTLANVFSLAPNEDLKTREKETRPLVSFLAEKRFGVQVLFFFPPLFVCLFLKCVSQVHLLYRRQGGDVPGNLFGLSRWARVILSSPLARELLAHKEDAQYAKELTALSAL